MYLFYKILILQNYKGYDNLNLSHPLSFHDVSKYNNDYLTFIAIYYYKYSLQVTNVEGHKLMFISYLVACINRIRDNIFIPDKLKHQLYNVYSNAKKTYNSLSRMLYLFKLKKAKISTFDTDLTLFPLDELTNNCKLTLYDEYSNVIYNFRISDIVNIINNSLSEAPYFFIDPIPIKNPQTNIKFSYSALCNLYFKLKQSTYVMPILFKLYFLSNFNLEIFVRHNESFIRDHAIVRYSKNMSFQSKIEYINLMIYDYDTIRKPIKIHDDFPQEKLIEAFAHLLHDYLLVKYTMHPKIKDNSDEKIHCFFKNFKKCNPNFGKRMVSKRLELILPTNKKLYKIHTFANENTIYYYYFIDNVFKNITELYEYVNSVSIEKLKLNNSNNNMNKYNKTLNRNKIMNRNRMINKKNLNRNHENSNFNFIISPINIHEITNEYASEFVSKTLNYIIDYLELCHRMENLTL